MRKERELYQRERAIPVLMRERERELEKIKRIKIFFLIVYEKGIYIFRQCAT